MSKIRSTSLLLVLLSSFVLPSCAGSPFQSRDKPVSADEMIVCTFTSPTSIRFNGRKVAGLTSYMPGRARVQVVESLVRGQKERVTVHELMHAAGLRRHEESRSCYIYPSAVKALPEHLCTAELIRLRESKGVVHVYVVDPADDDLVRWAVGFLNSEVGRTIFVLAERTEVDVESR